VAMTEDVAATTEEETTEEITKTLNSRIICYNRRKQDSEDSKKVV